MSNEYQTVDELKELGNKAVLEKNYEEAILHYTHAVKRDPTNPVLYSNRSFAFLKLKHYYYAFEDAEKTIKLNPNWPKGHYRKGEVQYAAGHYLEATKSYKTALSFIPDDKVVLSAVDNAYSKFVKERRDDDQAAWLGGGFGIVIGVTGVIADYCKSENPLHPILMVIITIAISLFAFGIAKGYRFYLKCKKESLLMPPPNYINLDEPPEEEKAEASPKQNARYTKSQARQRYKKGKI